MKKVNVFLLALMVIFIALNCRRNNIVAIEKNLDLIMRIDNDKVIRDSTNRLTLNVINKSDEKIILNEGFFKLQFTSSTTGTTKALYLNINNQSYYMKRKEIVMIEIEEKDTIIQKIDLGKILADDTQDEFLSRGDYSIRFVLENVIDKESNKLEEKKASNAVYVEVI